MLPSSTPTHIPPTAQTIELENILRDDVVRAVAAGRGGPRATRRSARATSSSCRRSSAATDGDRGNPTEPMTDLTRLLAHEMAARLRAGEVSSRELAEAHLDAAERQNHALQRLAGDRSRRRARRGRRRRRAPRRRARRGTGRRRRAPPAARHPGRAQGPRLGRGRPVHRRLADPRGLHRPVRRPHHRAAARRRRRDPRQDEHGRVRDGLVDRALAPTGRSANPWDLERVPGGSSGGSAAAVAAYHAPLSIGTDTGGSIRQPAALTGIVGLKPTYGRVSRYGIVAFASSLDQIGPFAPRRARRRGAAPRRSPAATSATRPRRRSPCPTTLLRLPAGDDEAAGGLRGKRLGLPRRVLRAGHGARTSRRGSARRSPRSRAPARRSRRSRLPHTDYGLATYYIIAPAEASANLARYDGVRYGHSARLDGRTSSRDYLATRGERLRRRGQAPDHARHLRPLGRLLRRLLPQGAEGAHADQARLRPGCSSGLRRARRADLARRSRSASARRLADPVAMYLSDACTLPVNMAGLPGISSRAACRRACRSGCS